MLVERGVPRTRDTLRYKIHNVRAIGNHFQPAIDLRLRKYIADRICKCLCTSILDERSYVTSARDSFRYGQVYELRGGWLNSKDVSTSFVPTMSRSTYTHTWFYKDISLTFHRDRIPWKIRYDRREFYGTQFCSRLILSCNMSNKFRSMEGIIWHRML